MMIRTLLDALRRQQMERYEEQKIYELDYRNPAVRDSDVVLINLAAEHLGLQKTVELAQACHARVVSLILWDPENLDGPREGGRWPEPDRSIPLEQAVVEFQARNMDLVYMRDPRDENGNRLIRLDFENVCA